MADRMSNRDRIAQRAAEADAAAQARAAAKATKAAKSADGAAKPRAAPKSAGRVRIVWLVCNPAGEEVRSFPYAQEAEARAAADHMTAELGHTHFVRRGEVPLEP